MQENPAVGHQAASNPDPHRKNENPLQLALDGSAISLKFQRLISSAFIALK
jgi:hypothetical protein